MNINKLILAAAVVGTAFAASANAAVIEEKKILEFKGPEVKTECVKWAKGKIFGKKWKTCIGHAYTFKTHQYFLTIEGPENLEDAARNFVRSSAATAIAVGITTAAAWPSPEPMTRAAAGLEAAKVSFLTALKGEALAATAIGQFSFRIDHREHW